jgi:signal transduction histidine kinase
MVSWASQPLIQRTELNDRQTELVDVISNSGKVLLRLIDDILDLSRIDAESFEVVEERLEIGELIDQCIAIIRPSADEQGLEIRFPGVSAEIPDLRGDIVRIKQILLNLLTNAVKFTESGHIEMGLDADRGPEGVTLTFRVSDTGVGIADDKLGQIFDRFYQIDGTVTRKHGGAGLGLAITQRLVDVMGGTIQVESELGVGTTFKVRLTLPPAGRTRKTT